MSIVAQYDQMIGYMMGVFGGSATLRVYSDGVRVDGEMVRTFTDYPITISINDFPQANSGMKSKFNTLIESDDKELLMQPINKADVNDTQPAIHANRDVIIINSTEWKILALKEMNPNGSDAVIYDMHLRR